MRYSNYCEFESKAILAVKRVVTEKLTEFRSWKGMDLCPALERHLISIVVNNRECFEDYLEQDAEIFFDKLNKEMLPKKKFLRRIFGKIIAVKKLYRFLSFLFTPGKTNGCQKFLIVTHHKKFIPYFSSILVSSGDVSWLFMWDGKPLSKTLPAQSHTMKLPFRNVAKALPRSLAGLVDQAERLEEFFKANKPYFVICAEGDAPYHSLLSELGKKHGFKSVCLQWGIFYDGWRDIAFSNMAFDFFLTWGKFFSNDLKNANKKSEFIEFGYPRLFKGPILDHFKKKKIVFLSQAPGGHITENNFSDFIELILDTKRNLIDFDIIYRPHPSDRLIDIEKYLRKEGISIDNSENILDQLSESICCVGITSSSLLEGFLSNSIPISFSSGCLKHSIAFEKSRIGLRLEKKTEALEAIQEFAKLGAIYNMYLENIKVQKKYFFSRPQYDLCNFLEKLEIRNASS